MPEASPKPDRRATLTPRHRWGTKRRLQALEEEATDADIDELIDRASKMGGGPKFMATFHPHPSWLWRQWHGTVLKETWIPGIFMMCIAAAVCASMETSRNWPLFAVPDGANAIVKRLKALSEMWSYLLTMATFVNSFFLSQAYGFWLATKGNTRKVQGRLMDICFVLATHAQRNENGRYSMESHALLQDVARHVRLFHMFFYASQVRPAKGDEHCSLSVLRTERGLQRLVARGILTEREFELLTNGRVPVARSSSIVLEWIQSRFIAGRNKGIIGGGAGTETMFLDKVLLLRAVCASIGDDQAARMPLAYVHLVQVLLDTLVVLAPFALYSRLGVFTIPLVGILTTFYRGFLVLSKSFLDPFGNEDTLSENLSIMCLINESNAGSVLWFNGIDEMPFDDDGNQTAVQDKNLFSSPPASRNNSQHGGNALSPIAGSENGETPAKNGKQS